MGRKREKKDKAPQRNNYKAEDLLRICYPDDEGGDEVTVNRPKGTVRFTIDSVTAKRPDGS